MLIAIIGHGFVGGAVDYGFSNTTKVIIDPKYGDKGNGFGSDIEWYKYACPEFTFICVPTPMGDNGSIDVRHIESSLHKIRTYWPETTVIIKSTVTPQVLTDIEKRYELNLVYNPEFLRETSAKEDFANPHFHVFGGKRQYTERVQQLYDEESNCSPCPVFHMTPVEASFVKYMVNSYFATKVTFFNSYKAAMENWDSDIKPNFNTVIKAVGSDPRIGHSHTKVPGHDGKPGYGGSCLPKDVGAIINSEELPLLQHVQNINSFMRQDQGLTNREKEQNVNFDR